MSDDVSEQTLPDLDRIEADLAAVGRALGRLDGDTYGRCVVCDAPLDDAVLAADPLREHCEDHLSDPVAQRPDPAPADDPAGAQTARESGTGPSV